MFKYLLILIIFTTSLLSQELKIYTEESPPMNFLNKQGEIDGYSTEVVREIQRRTGDISLIEMLPWNRAYNLAIKKNNPNVMLYSTAFSEERRELFHWLGPLYDNTWSFYALASKDIVINSLEDAKKVNRIGTYSSDIREQFLYSEGFENIASFRNVESNIHALLTGRTDLWITSNISFNSIAKKENINPNLFKEVYTIRTTGVYIVFSIDTSKVIIDRWNSAFNNMKKDGTLKKIQEKWGIPIPSFEIP